MEFDVLDRRTCVLGTHFLEASAGTGKTFAIEHITVRLLLQEEKKMKLSDILIVTFTKAATRELKSRIYGALQNALFHLEQDLAPFDYLKEVLENSKEKAIVTLKEALALFEEVQIFTIHGFCHHLLQAFAFEAKMPLSPGKPSDAEHVDVALQAVRVFLRSHIQPKRYSPSQLSKVVRKFRYEMGKLEDKLLQLALQEHDIASHPSFEESFSLFVSRFQMLPAMSQEAFLSAFDKLPTQYKQMTGKEMQRQGELFAEAFGGKPWDERAFEELLKMSSLFLEKLEEENRKVKAAREPLAEIFACMRENLLPIYLNAKETTATVLRMGKEVRDLYQEKMASEERISPSDLLLRTQEALQDPLFLSYAQNLYQAAIIDEFQDTDPVQWDIFKTLFLGKIEHLYLVGDPKQAIYAFRSADIYTYLDALESIGVEKKRALKTNFRSSPPLISALNALFALRPIPIPKRQAYLPIEPVHAGKQGEEGGIHFFIREEDPSPRAIKWPSDEIEETYFFPFIAGELKKRPYHTACILVKDRFQAAKISTFLKSLNIPVCVKRKGSLIDTFAFEVLKDILEATYFPSHLSKLKKALSSPCIGWNSLRLKGNFLDPSLAEARGKFVRLKNVLLEEGFVAFWHAFLNTVWQEETLKSDEPSFYQELEQLCEILAQEETLKGTRGLQVLSFLEKAQQRSHDPLFQIKERTSQEAVQIMTIHMSKGLEFETVFAYGLLSRGSLPDEIVVEGKTQVFDEKEVACHKALEEIHAEKLRLLYVALTRAKTHLYIPLLLTSTKPPFNSSPLELFFKEAPPAVLSELSMLAEQYAVTVTRLETPQTATCAEPLPCEPKKELIPPTLLPQEEGVFSFTSLVKEKEDPSILKKPSPLDLPTGKETGIFFHAILEKIFQTRAHRFFEKRALLVENALCGSRYLLWKDQIHSQIQSLFITPFSDGTHTFCLQDLEENHFFEEMEFSYQIPEGMMKGVIDLTFVIQGKYYFLDWKTNYLETYTQESMLQEIEKHDYRLQATLYQEALSRYVKLFDTTSFGGAFYVFIRGNSHVFFPP